MDQNQSFSATFKDSVSNFSGYKNFLSRTFGSTFKYFYLLLLILFFIGSIKTAIFLIPQTPAIDRFVVDAKEFIKAGYPSDLIVNIKNGQLSTNQPDPYFINLPKQFDSKTQPGKFHLIAIDTKGKVEDFAKYNSAILLTKTAAVSMDKDNALKVYPFKSNYNFKIDKNSYDAVSAKIIPYLDNAKPIIISFVILALLLVPFLLAGLQLIGKIIVLALWSVLFFIISKLMSKNLSFKQVYKLSFFASTLPIIISTSFNLITLSTGIFGQIANIVLFIIMIYVIVKFKKMKISIN